MFDYQFERLAHCSECREVKKTSIKTNQRQHAQHGFGAEQTLEFFVLLELLV